MDFHAEGKTKRIEALPPVGRFHHKDDITAGDGARHDIVPGKGRLSCKTNANVSELLKVANIPQAFLAQDSPTTHVGLLCTMIPLEVVVRFEAQGSYLKRNPLVTKGTVFKSPIVEMYLKTSNRTWLEHSLPCDDPLVRFVSEWGRTRMRLYKPNMPELEGQIGEFEVTVQTPALLKAVTMLDALALLAARAGRVLQKAWSTIGDCRLLDLKVECGFCDGKLLLADVIDADSWRLVDGDGQSLSKQGYRDGDGLADVLRTYEMVASYSDGFQQIHGEIKHYSSYHDGRVPRFTQAFLTS